METPDGWLSNMKSVQTFVTIAALLAIQMKVREMEKEWDVSNSLRISNSKSLRLFVRT